MAFFFLSFLLIFPVWMRGGTRLEMMGPVPWLALAAFFAMVTRPSVREGDVPVMSRIRVWRSLLSDPILYVGILFLLILGLQWWNGPRAEVFDVTTWKWTFGSPPRPHLPLFCIDRKEALEMLFWFVPFYVAILVVRNGLLRQEKLNLLKLLAYNAGVVGVFGLIQAASGTSLMYGLTPMKVYFFSSFGYQNHGGAFFVLASILAGGLLLRNLLKLSWRNDFAGLTALLLICAASAVLSKSRAAIFLTGFVLAGGVAYGVHRVGRQHGKQGVAAILVSLFAIVAVAVYVIVVVPNNPVREELKGTTLDGMVARVELGADPLKEAAWSIWEDNRLFGVGGWGFRHYLPHAVPASKASVFTPGQANVHNDPLQFLVEFGLVGVGLLAVTVMLLVVPAIRAIFRIPSTDGWDKRARFLKIPPLGLALLAGPCLTFFHSFADLPFRSPAILWMWGVLLACASSFCERDTRSRSQEKSGDTSEPDREQAETSEPA